MVVVQLGTLQGGGCLRTRMEVLQLRDDAWWKRAVIASKIISLVGSSHRRTPRRPTCARSHL